MRKRTKIICTIGPASESEETLRELMAAGMNIARLNFSHGSHEEHAARIARIKKVREEFPSPCAIMLDTKGPEIRTGVLEGGRSVELSKGAVIVLAESRPGRDEPGTAERITQSCIGLSTYVEEGSAILVDDGLIGLSVLRVDGADIVCRVENGGLLGQRKSVNVPGVHVPLPAVTDKDRADLLFGIEQGVDFVAASFVRSADNVREIKSFLAANGGTDIGVIAKIEAADAVGNIDDIIRVSDGVMVARGDLGVEVPAHKVPHIQKQIIRKCNDAHRPVITATQMLDSMIRNPRPTRAEVADVANAIYDGTDCVMLSGETASGDYPVESVKTMASIAEESEANLFIDAKRDRSHIETNGTVGAGLVSLAVATAAVQTAELIDATCIVAPTLTGRTPRLISSFRSPVRIFSVTPLAGVVRKMQLCWGVVPLLGDAQGDIRRVMEKARDTLREHGFLKLGDIAVFTSGDAETSPCIEPGRALEGPVALTNVMNVVQIR